MRLIHLANHASANIGNGALILGTERVLAEDVDAGVQFIRDDWDAYKNGRCRFDRDFIERVNRDSDALLVGAAVSLNGDARYANAGMRFDLPYDLWSSLEVPVIFYAISYKRNLAGIYHHRDQLRRAVQYVLDSPRMLFSVRNDGTKPWLESLLGFTSDRIVAIPDPALYVPTVETPHVELEHGRTNILVSLNNEDVALRFTSPAPQFQATGWAQSIRSVGYLSARMRGIKKHEYAWRRNRHRFISQLAAALHRIARERLVNFVLCPHHSDDHQLMDELRRQCPQLLMHENTIPSGVPPAPYALSFYNLYAKADALLSMRVHSMTPAVGLGTPLVALVCDPRMANFLSDTGLEEYGVDVLDRDLADKVHDRVTYLLDQRQEVRQQLGIVWATLRERTRIYNQRIKAILQQQMRAITDRR